MVKRKKRKLIAVVGVSLGLLTYGLDKIEGERLKDHRDALVKYEHDFVEGLGPDTLQLQMLKLQQELQLQQLAMEKAKKEKDQNYSVMIQADIIELGNLGRLTKASIGPVRALLDQLPGDQSDLRKYLGPIEPTVDNYLKDPGLPIDSNGRDWAACAVTKFRLVGILLERFQVLVVGVGGIQRLEKEEADVDGWYNDCIHLVWVLGIAGFCLTGYAIVSGVE